jgi:hypothetical protein
MKHILRCLVVTLALGVHRVGSSSDHADPMSLNVLVPQDAPVANITDLHTFVVNKDGVPVLSSDGVSSGDQLILSLCVRRRLLFGQINDPELERQLPEVSFRIHMDLDPVVKHFNTEKLPDGRKAAEVQKQLEDAVSTAKLAVENHPKESTEASQLTKALTDLSNFLAARQIAAHMESLYGGTIESPFNIAEEALLNFHLGLEKDEKTLAVNVDARLSGIPGSVNIVTGERYGVADSVPMALTKNSEWKRGRINVQAGVFDDPFIFPRFFRGNVIGIVVSIPLELLQRSDGSPAQNGTILVWATTHGKDGKQSDHVGRSLRTQLPRFGYLNVLHPADHVEAILRRHGQPTLMENALGTFLAPLEAHRFYDPVPDVIIYDLTKPAMFPNGRWLEDDVAKVLADAGETLLYELSLTESKQFPRATTNDKPFRKNFPYLAEPWTELETKAHALIGTTFEGGFKVPDGPDSGATALPDFVPEVWTSIWRALVIGIILSAGLAAFLLKHFFARIIILLTALFSLWALTPILPPKPTLALMPTAIGNKDAVGNKEKDAGPTSVPTKSMVKAVTYQPIDKLNRFLFGTGIITGLGIIAVYAAGMRHGGLRLKSPSEDPLLQGEGLEDGDRQYEGSTYEEVRTAVFSNPYNSAVPWGSPDIALPTYSIPIRTLLLGLFSRSVPFWFRDASQRTIKSHADLRWGKDGKGVRRLLHPHGVCLAGEWRITKETSFSGAFATNSKCLIIARYSSEEVLRSKPRNLSLSGKLFPTMNPEERVRTASFFAQSALGGLKLESIFDAKLRNAPEVRPFASVRGFFKLLISALVFRTVDSHVTERQLYEIAEAGDKGDSPEWKPTSPRYMQLTIKSPTKNDAHFAPDFRDEILSQIYERGEARRIGSLVFKIEVSDKGRRSGILNQKLVDTDWSEIGEIEFNDAVASYNGDFVIHFHHPLWNRG